MSNTSSEDALRFEVITTEGLRRALSMIFSDSTFACGGTIKAKQPEQTSLADALLAAGHAKKSVAEDQVQALAEPITIRWDSATSIEKLTLPLSGNEINKENSDIAKLAAGTQPASFGFYGQDVIDESYRKASKLDTSAFSTNFCPYESGIIDIIGQALPPKSPGSTQGIRAELYKLNIYQAPSGFFKPHVDTPRSELQFGSLVVCLPCDHEGGQLVVRHRGRTTKFDWSGPTKDIKWAAFYSDCEHEVYEVTAGHRLTLTYNLYMRRGLGELAGHSNTLNVQQLPAYMGAKEALANSGFMAKGGLLGRYCSHAYAHATRTAETALPSILKGSDMIAYEIFSALGIKVHVRPVADHISKHMYPEELDDKPELRDRYHVGKQLTEPINTCTEWGENGGIDDVYEAYPSTLEKVIWLNHPTKGNESVQFGYAAYGNQAESAFEYSFCALLFEIPPYPERCEIAKGLAYNK